MSETREDEVESAGLEAAEPEPEARPPGEGTPEGDALVAAERAFEIGDYRKVRQLTGDLVEAKDPEVRRAALALRERISIDPVQVVVILACAAVLGALVYVYVI